MYCKGISATLCIDICNKVTWELAVVGKADKVSFSFVLLTSGTPEEQPSHLDLGSSAGEQEENGGFINSKVGEKFFSSVALKSQINL